MPTNRLEAFSESVIAIIITMMVLVALLWLVPDKRLERAFARAGTT